MDWNELLNLLLGGGLAAALLKVLTLKAAVRQAEADAEKAIAEAEAVRIDNAEHATRILIENIVEPLKKELGETREELRETKKELGSTKREMARFRKAVESANGCKFRVDCPVLFKLRYLPKDEGSNRADRSPSIRGQPATRGADCGDGDGTTVGGENGDTDRQPP